MARFYVFDTQAAAQAAVEAINARARELYRQWSYEVDETGAIIGKRASDGADMPDAAKTVTWDIPRQRLDGQWIVAHTETCPGHDVVLPDGTTLVWQYVAQDVSAPVEAYDPAWFPVVTEA